MPGRHQFASLAQMRWAFGTHKSWAHRWAENTELAGRSKMLPRRKGRMTARTLRKAG